MIFTSPARSRMMLLGFMSQWTSRRPCTAAEGLAGADEAVGDVPQGAGVLLVDRRALHVLHHQRRLLDPADEHPLADLQVDALAQAGVAEGLADLELVLELLDEAEVLLGLRHDVLQGVLLLGLASLTT